MSAHFSINSTYGAAFVGIQVAGVLLGMSTTQAWYYYTHSKDKNFLPVLVATVLVFDFIHQALICHTGYTYLVSFYGEAAKLETVVWSFSAAGLFNGLTALAVQCFLTYRISMLSGKKIWLTAFVGSFVLAEFVCVLTFAIIALMRVKTFEELSAELKGLSITVNALAAAGDLLIAGILTILLQRAETGYRSSDTMINKLTLFAVNTGALTSLCAVASLISILAAPNTFIYIPFFFSMGRLYTNSLLATLNARKSIRDSPEGVNTSSVDNISLPSDLERGASPSLSFQHMKNTRIAIQVDTTREYTSDLECGMGPGMVATRERHDQVEEEDLAELTILSSQEDITSNGNSPRHCKDGKIPCPCGADRHARYSSLKIQKIFKETKHPSPEDDSS
ncbi:hypothetical protein BT96DRAFT_1023613 [Gymnopus androsaceus JB14]|uniref:DUF6534 domain-containing protein n=1 Tax=Gymnopus androsaceus JB14 TaxID=1447944 RepID=A0A6A4H2Q8_9AGAR|nr:hypothetical protein BT96DRAFT_1023613 [Gymnopus androsaceus JB14]